MAPPQAWTETPFDPSAYSLTEDEAMFFKAQIGIEDDDALREHLVSVLQQAYQVHPYPCIRRFSPLRLKISRLPAYQDALSLLQRDNEALFLELGCCVGTDVRKAIADGIPAQQVITSDIEPDFWRLGHTLFQSTQESFPVRFLPGDLFEPAFLSASSDSPPGPNSLNALKQRAHVIHASALFHLFPQAAQADLAARLATLLAPVPGALIFGAHAGTDVPGTRLGALPWLHSPDSWRALWVSVFPPGAVRVDAVIMEIEELRGEPRVVREPGAPTPAMRWLVWSVRRVG